MEEYERETGKFAIWRGVITEGFKKWQKGEKIYEQDKERITILVAEEKKRIWQKIVEINNFSSISKLIRNAVDFYIDSKFKTPSFMKRISRITHGFKEPLTLIKGFSQIIIENYKDELSSDLLAKIRDIFNQSLNLENRINMFIEDFKGEKYEYDILIVDDDISSIKVLATFFDLRSYSSKALRMGSEVIKEVEQFAPKIILLDILLPDISGFDICKMIKSNEKIKHTPVFYITAVPFDEVEEKMGDTGADGYFLKPFNFLDFDILFDYL